MSVFFFNDTATTEIYTLSLHDALPIWRGGMRSRRLWLLLVPTLVVLTGWPLYHYAGCFGGKRTITVSTPSPFHRTTERSEEHTSELQSRQYLVCRLLLEKKKEKQITYS